MMGNSDLYSTFECDTCNQKFSLFESDLASFLGLGRSISGMNQNRKPPGFPGIHLEAKTMLFKNKHVLLINKENAERNLEDGTTKLKYQKPSYTPANVYKILLKCALSVLTNEEVVSDFQLALEYLQGNKVLLGAHINVFRFPLSVKMPLHVYIFKRKYAADKMPVYVVSFYFDNLIITLPILLHRDDLRYFDEPIEIPASPPYFVHGNDIGALTPTFSSHDLRSPNKVKDESEEMTMSFDKSDLAKVSRFDPKTTEETQSVYNPSGSKYFIVTEEGAVFTSEELIELSNLIAKKFPTEIN